MDSDCPFFEDCAEAEDVDDFEDCGLGDSYDGGFGHGSYFEHAMGKDD